MSYSVFIYLNCVSLISVPTSLSPELHRDCFLLHHHSSRISAGSTVMTLTSATTAASHRIYTAGLCPTPSLYVAVLVLDLRLPDPHVLCHLCRLL